MNQVLQGDCLEVMRGMADCSVDAVVTDPPYGLSFMGRTWDYDVPKVEVWREVLRVLKPGGHLLSFAGSRTHHRMAVNIEDAGFDLRDTLMWVYGSGFPKSHDVSKAIDKAAEAERDVVGTVKRLQSYGYEGNNCFGGDVDRGGVMEITASATPAARQWAGWGSALKPAFEPITLARKPLQGTIAQNVQEWGTGALNIDGCRVETDELKGKVYNNKGDALSWGGTYGKGTVMGNPSGRWPANVIHDGSEEVVGCFPETVSGVMKAGTKRNQGGGYHGGFPEIVTQYDTVGDSGSAARFFKQCPDTDPEDAETHRLIDSRCIFCGGIEATRHGIMRESSMDSLWKSTANFAAQSSNQTITTTASDSATTLVQPRRRQEKKGREQKLNANVTPVESSFLTSQATKESIVLTSAEEKDVEKIAHRVKCAENLCASCAIVIAQSVVQARQGNPPASILGADFISEHKKQILIQNLAPFVDLLQNTDTIPTTASLKLLLGSVCHAIEKSMPSTSEKLDQDFPRKHRLVYQGKATKRDRDEGLEGFEAIHRPNGNKWTDQDYRVARGERPPSAESGPRANHHPTVKPTDLMRYLCRLITPPGGIILDPFTGSGSTGKAAILEGFGFIGIEQEPEYVAIANARIAAAAARSEKATLEQRVAWLETQTQALGAKVRRLEASQQLSLWGTP